MEIGGAMKDYIKTNIKNTKRIIRKTNKDRYDRIKKNRYIPMMNLILKYADKSGSLLDIGIREGAFLDLLRDNGFTDLFGIDVFEDGVRMANERGFNCVIADAQNFNLNLTFDIITLSHVFEHVPQPEKVAENVYNHLKTGGVLYVEVPKQKKESVPTVHAHYYCFESLKEFLSFFDESRWEILEQHETTNKKRPDRGILRLVAWKK